MKNASELSSEIVAALSKTDGSKEAACRVLQDKLGHGFAQGLETLAAYCATDDGDASASDMEMGALIAARQIVRPVLQEKLQKRLDSMDDSKKKPAVPAANTRRVRKGGGLANGRVS